MGSRFYFDLSKKIHIFHLKVWVLVAIFLDIFTVLVLFLLWCCIVRNKSRTKNTLPPTQIPIVSKEIKVTRVEQNSANHVDYFLTVPDKHGEKDSEKLLIHFNNEKERNADGSSQCGSFSYLEKDDAALESGENKGSLVVKQPASHSISVTSPLAGLSEHSHLGWGHWFTLRDLEMATNKFSKENVIGEGGYGVVYRGQVINGTFVAVKRLLNNLGQAEKEFRVEVEAIGHVRHKNLVRLLGYCIEGTLYKYISNGNLEQWLHGAKSHHGHLTWEGRMKILLGTAKALAYLHEAIEPKVVHRDIKSSNILIDDDFNAKISDSGLAKLLGAGKSHIITRVMGTFGISLVIVELRKKRPVPTTTTTTTTTRLLKNRVVPQQQQQQQQLPRLLENRASSFVAKKGSSVLSPRGESNSEILPTKSGEAEAINFL
ncbi:hypothetical protein Pfo_025880 [Paulownia fortunei]|nr:hypothetical protein Pfo_025880 [Paulownia fortunei]